MKKLVVEVVDFKYFSLHILTFMHSTCEKFH